MNTQSTTLTIKLSEAIRLGSMLGRQVKGHFVGSDQSSCALGAAFLAVGYPVPIDVEVGNYIRTPFPLLSLLTRCPCGCRFFGSVAVLIAQLNDSHHWTREQIAEWVETLENADTSKTEQKETVCQ